jgi:hypothetical protein
MPVAGTLASYLIGRAQGRAATRSQARPALNRAVTIHQGVVDAIEAIESRRSFLEEAASQDQGQLRTRDVGAALDLLHLQALGQLRSASDAILDWGEVIPEDVQRIGPAGPAGSDNRRGSRDD